MVHVFCLAVRKVNVVLNMASNWFKTRISLLLHKDFVIYLVVVRPKNIAKEQLHKEIVKLRDAPMAYVVRNTDFAETRQNTAIELP